MKVVALGGAGAMGSFAVKDLAGKDSVEELLIADYNLEAAEELARSLGKKCKAVKVDANNPAEITRIVKGFDVALGTIGPFYKYAVKVASACIDAGVDFVDICDDYDAVMGFLELNEKAKKAKVTAITGVGWTPGLTNVFARRAADKLDEVDEIATSWGCHPSDTAGKAVTLHYIHAVTGMIPSFINGRLVWIPAASGVEKMKFPEPVGEMEIFHAGHPEPVTIPRYIDAETVTLKGGLKDKFLVGLGNFLVRLKLTNTERKKDVIGGIFNTILPYLENIGKPPESASACRTDVTGKKDGKWVHIAYGAVAHMDMLTCLPASIAVQMIGEGVIKKNGAFPPEAIIPPVAFLKRCVEGGIKLFEGADMTEPMKL